MMNIQSLKCLNLSNNEFVALPYQIYSLKYLKEFTFDWFKYTNPPMQ